MTTNRQAIMEAAQSNGWRIHGMDELVITRHDPPTRLDVHFGARGQITYAARNGRSYTGTARRDHVIRWLTERPQADDPSA